MRLKLQPRVAASAVIISLCLLATIDVSHATHLNTTTTSEPQLLQPPTGAQNVTTPANNAEKEKKYIDDDFMKVRPW